MARKHSVGKTWQYLLSGDDARAKDQNRDKGYETPAHVNFPTHTTDSPAPVVTFQAPLTLTAPTGMVNGTRLDKLDAPPGKAAMAVALSAIVTTPGEVVVGITVQNAR